MEINSTGQPQNNSASSQSSARLTENFDAFLTLLTTQLKHQNPLEPLDSQDFVGQLVQFSAVEQAIRGNQSLEKLIELQNTSQTTAALGYIGNQVEVTGNTAPLINGKAEFSYTLPENTGKSTIVVQDAAGKVVFSTSGETTTGKHSFVWDGVENGGGTAAPGNYSLTVAAKNTNDKQVEGITTTAFGTVTGIESSAAGLALSLNGALVPIDAVLSVRRVAAVP